MKKYTQKEIDDAIEWHMTKVNLYTGPNTPYRRLTLDEATAEVEQRVNWGINLTGFNATPQHKWTY